MLPKFTRRRHSSNSFGAHYVYQRLHSLANGAFRQLHRPHHLHIRQGISE